jgi:hypothetical protein
MSRETPAPPELDPNQVADFAATFLSRGDYYPRQKDTGAYFVVDKSLHVGVVMAHLRGVMTIGAYALSPIRAKPSEADTRGNLLRISRP